MKQKTQTFVFRDFKMSQRAALNPRFSAKAAFSGNIIDATDSEYATHKAKNYPRNAGQCSVKAAQPPTQVQAVRRVREVNTPTEEDREHWKGKNVVAQTRKVQGRQPVNLAAKQIRPRVAAPVANPDNKAWAQQMGQRQVQHQKLQRAARQGASVPEQNANSFVATVPRELLESESFILEMPQAAFRGNVVRPSQLPQNAITHEQTGEVDDEEELKANRQYWGGKNVVHRSAGAKQCAAPQPRVIARGPGCQQRAAPATKDALRAVPKKVAPRQAVAPVKKVTVRQAVPQKTVVQAKKQAAPVKRSGGCPCNR